LEFYSSLQCCNRSDLGQRHYFLRTTTDSGAVVMTASTGSEFSIERPEWGHGAFTKAVIEGLKEFRADFNTNGSIEIKELDLFVTERVKELTGGRQHTTTEIPQTLPNFPIAVR